MNDQTTTLQDLKSKISAFVNDREWQQFHTAKNLSMAIAAEAAELMEHFLWVEGQEAEKKMTTKRTDIEHEIADIFYMTLCLANAYHIDLTTILNRKHEINAAKYPIEKSKGNAKKYTEFE